MRIITQTEEAERLLKEADDFSCEALQEYKRRGFKPHEYKTVISKWYSNFEAVLAQLEGLHRIYKPQDYFDYFSKYSTEDWNRLNIISNAKEYFQKIKERYSKRKLNIPYVKIHSEPLSKRFKYALEAFKGCEQELLHHQEEV